MSLTGALYTSFSGLRNIEGQINTTSSNVTNADKPGYTRKTYESNYQTTNSGTVPVSGQITSAALDPYLQQTLIDDTSVAAKSEIEADYLGRYADRLGSTGGGNTLSASLDDLESSLDQLSVTPDDSSLKSQAVSDADNLAFQVRDLSDQVQDLRLQADQEIEQVVNDINNTLENIEQLNKKINLSSATGQSTADLEDERRYELEQLAENIDIDYYIDGDNQIRIYTGGQPLLTGQQAYKLDFTATGAVNSTITYPAGLSGVTVNGRDITTSIDGGKLSGLIDMRDVALVEEQQKLDEFAIALQDTMNSLHNQGASIPPRSDIVGDIQNFLTTDTLGGTGLVRIAVTDQNGGIISTNDFDLATYTTVGDMITDINTTLGPDVTASLTPDGSLQLVANNTGEGISLNELTSDIGADNDGFSSYFALNNMFTGTGAEDLQVSDYLKDNSDFLATSYLSDDPILTTGDTGIFTGDGSLSKALNDAFEATHTSLGQSLGLYAGNIMSDVALRADNASDRAETDRLFLDQTRTSLQNFSGVNIDEEMIKLIDLEAKYEASATLIATIQDMFDELIGAVR